MSDPSVEQPEETQPKLDELGRVITEEAEAVPECPFPELHPLIDTNTNVNILKELSEENKEVVINIVKRIVLVMKTTQRITVNDIKKIAEKIFKESLVEEISSKVFMDSIRTIPVNTDALAALIGYFTCDYADSSRRALITETIPKAIAEAFTNDQYTTIRRYLHFLGFFVSYNLVTPSSYLELLNALADKVPEISSYFRCDAICHAVLFACRTAPEEIREDDIKQIVDKLSPYVVERKSFANKFYPCDKEIASSITELLFNCGHFESHCRDYVELFTNRTPLDIPHVDLVLGENDQAPPPMVFLKDTYTEVPEYFPVLLDIAMDYIFFLGDDIEALFDQYFAFPLINADPSLKSEYTIFSNETHTQYIEAIITALLSDLMRVPHPSRKIIFYVSILTFLLKASYNVTDIFINCVESITNSISLYNIGAINNLVRVLAHITTNTKDHIIPLRLEKWVDAATLENPDSRKMFIQSYIQLTYSYSSQKLPQDIPEEIKKLIVPKVKEDVSEDIKKIQKILKEEGLKINDELAEQTSKFGELDALTNLVKAIIVQANSAEAAIKQIDKYSSLISDMFQEDWKGRVLIEAIYSIFKATPTSVALIITFLIERSFISIDQFFKWFFDISKIKARCLSTMDWVFFNYVMDSVFKFFDSNGKYDEMVDGIIKLYQNVIPLQIQDVLSEKILLGNVKAFTLRHMNVFNSKCKYQLRSIIPDDAKNFLDFFEKISLIYE